MPKAREVNEILSIDLKPVSSVIGKKEDRRYLVYAVCEFSKFIVGGISPNKEAENVAKVLLDISCLNGLVYPSGGFHMDNGNEFKKNYVSDIARRLGVKVTLTPSYSPWSNGVAERRHGVVDVTIKKMMEDEKSLDISDALKHALWARNMEVGSHGYSPYQVVYGKSPAIPGVSDGNVCSDSLITDAEIVRRHFGRQEEARKHVRAADASRRIKDALKSRVFP